MVERCVRDAEVGGSNPLTPTTKLQIAALCAGSALPFPMGPTRTEGRSRLCAIRPARDPERAAREQERAASTSLRPMRWERTRSKPDPTWIHPAGVLPEGANRSDETDQGDRGGRSLAFEVPHEGFCPPERPKQAAPHDPAPARSTPWTSRRQLRAMRARDGVPWTPLGTPWTPKRHSNH